MKLYGLTKWALMTPLNCNMSDITKSRQKLCFNLDHASVLKIFVATGDAVYVAKGMEGDIKKTKCEKKVYVVFVEKLQYLVTCNLH